MEIAILRLSSPDLIPEVGGLPTDTMNFDVGVEVMLAQKNKEGDDVSFTFRVVSEIALRQSLNDGFFTQTLVLSEFSWVEIRQRIERLIMQLQSCTSWECVAFRVAPFMRPLGVTFDAL